MMREQRIYQLAHWIASFIIALVFLSGYQKLLYPDEFAVSVYRFHLIPGMLVNLVALFIPWLEMVCAVSLLFIPRWRIPALWIVLVLLILFTGVIAINLWRGSQFGCGCFGRYSDDPMNWLSVARNVALIALVGLALIGGRKSEA